jgi:hypothetical protein
MASLDFSSTNYEGFMWGFFFRYKSYVISSIILMNTLKLHSISLKIVLLLKNKNDIK